MNTTVRFNGAYGTPEPPQLSIGHKLKNPRYMDRAVQYVKDNLPSSHPLPPIPLCERSRALARRVQLETLSSSDLRVIHLARALIASPDLLVLHRPICALDEDVAEQVSS